MLKPKLSSLLIMLMMLAGTVALGHGQSEVASLTLNQVQGTLRSAAIDTVNGFGYFGTAGSTAGSGVVVKISLSTFSVVGVLATPFRVVSTGLIDTANGFGYFSGYEGSVIKVSLSTFTNIGQLNIGCWSEAVVQDPTQGFSYYACKYGTVSKVQLSDFSFVGALTLTGYPKNGLGTATIDPAGGFAYFGTFFNSPTQVFQVRLLDFTLANTLNLKGGQFASTSVIDNTSHFLYYGNSGSPGRVLRISIPDLKRVDALTLNKGQDNLEASVIDTARGLAFFGTDTSPGIVVKINLSTFTETGSVTLQPGENELLFSHTIDATSGFAYFGTFTSPGIIVKIAE